MIFLKIFKKIKRIDNKTCATEFSSTWKTKGNQLTLTQKYPKQVKDLVIMRLEQPPVSSGPR